MGFERKVASGQDMDLSPLERASFVNDVIDIVNDYKLRRQQGIPTQSSVGFSSGNDVIVQNNSGADRAAGDVVQLGAGSLASVMQDYPWFAGATPAAPVNYGYAVLREPIKSTQYGPAAVAGAVIANVYVNSTSDKYATPVASQNYFASGGGGPIEILGTLSSTGLQLLWTRFVGGIGTFMCQISSNVSAATSSGSGSSTVWTPGSGSALLFVPNGSGGWANSTISFTVYNSTKSAISALYSDGVTSKLLQGKYINGYPFIDVEGCS